MDRINRLQGNEKRNSVRYNLCFKKIKYNCLKQAAGDPKPKHSPAACFTLVDAKFRAKLSMPYALMKELSRFAAYRSPVRMYAAICQKRTPCSRSPSGNPLHFADRRDESVIVGYCTSAEVPFGCSKGTPGGRSPLKKGAAAWWQRPLGAI